MRLFLDSSVLLAASGSSKGASRLLLEEAGDRGWTLATSVYCIEETLRNLHRISARATVDFHKAIAPAVQVQTTTHVVDRPLVFAVSKDRPVLASALALGCDVLLTLDRADFQALLGGRVYGMLILTPGDWLRRQRASGET